MATQKLPWDHPLNAKLRSDSTATVNNEPSLTQLSMQEQADINWIVRNFMPEAIPTTRRLPMSGDFTGITDYRGAIEQARAAEAAFMNLPAELRQRLDNDPQNFLEWAQDPSNQDELIKYGLASDKRPKPEPKPEVKPPTGGT